MTDSEPRPPRDLLHALQVHQIELEMQNEELSRSRTELEESRARFVELYDQAPLGYCTVNDSGMVLQANLTLSTLLGVARDALLNQPLSRFIAKEDQDVFYHLRRQLFGGAGSGSFNARSSQAAEAASCELRMLKGEGLRFWTLLAARLVAASPERQRSDAGNPQVLHLTVSDITQRKQAEEKLRLAASVLAHTREGVMITDTRGNIVDVNEAFTRITGYTREDVLGQNPRLLKSGRQDAAFYAAIWRDLLSQGHWSGEIWNRRKNGEVFAELETISAVRDDQGRIQHYVALFSDITQIKVHQNTLHHMAHFDALTKLPNRLLLADRLEQALAQGMRRGETVAVVFLDLDGFKTINDGHGHAVGDELLAALATRMRQALREADTLARVGGDEFVAVLADLDDAQASEPLLERLLAAAAESVSVGGVQVQVSASMGVAFYPQGQDISAEQLLHQADQAMYQAKLAGKNCYRIFGAG